MDTIIECNIGDTVVYKTIMDRQRKVVVTDKGKKDGYPIFDGYEVDDTGKRISNIEVWGYDSDIIEIVQRNTTHAKQPLSDFYDLDIIEIFIQVKVDEKIIGAIHSTDGEKWEALLGEERPYKELGFSENDTDAADEVFMAWEEEGNDEQD